MHARRYMFGGGVGTMTLDELDVLEKHLEIWICNVRSTKVSIFFYNSFVFVQIHVVSSLYSFVLISS